MEKFGCQARAQEEKYSPSPKCSPASPVNGILFVEFAESLGTFPLVSDTVLAPAQDFIVLKFH